MNQVKSKKSKVKNMFRNTLRLCVSVVLSASFALNIFAQKETAPVGGQPKAFVFPAVETYTLKNGMKVSLVPYGSVPKVAIQAFVRTGSLNEKAGQRWISDVVAALLKEGTPTRDAEAIARETAEMGGSIFTGAQTDKTVIGGEVLSEFDVRFLTLMADVMLNPKFAPDDLETIRANKFRELSNAKLQPGNIAAEKFRQVIYPNHPYGEIFASEATLKSYKLEDVKSYYNENYGAARTHLYVVGQFDGAKVKQTIEKLFGGWKKGPDAIRSVPKIEAKRSMTIIDRPGAPQSTIYRGMPATSGADEDCVLFTVTNTI